MVNNWEWWVQAENKERVRNEGGLMWSVGEVFHVLSVSAADCETSSMVPCDKMEG